MLTTTQWHTPALPLSWCCCYLYTSSLARHGDFITAKRNCHFPGPLPPAGKGSHLLWIMEATAPYNSKKQNNNTNVSLSRLLVAIIITVCVCSREQHGECVRGHYREWHESMIGAKHWLWYFMRGKQATRTTRQTSAMLTLKRCITKKTQISLHTLDKYMFFFLQTFNHFMVY